MNLLRLIEDLVDAHRTLGDFAPVEAERESIECVKVGCGKVELALGGQSMESLQEELQREEMRNSDLHDELRALEDAVEDFLAVLDQGDEAKIATVREELERML